MKYLVRNPILLILTVFMTLGIVLGSSNYQFTVERIEAGTLVDIPALADLTTQYIDATDSISYGTVTNGPPNGMGNFGSGPTDDTELLEEGDLYETNDTLETTAFPSLPSGWSTTQWTVTGGEAIANEWFSDRILTTKAYNLGPYTSVFIDFSWAAYDGVGVAASTYQLQKYEGSWVTVLNTPVLTTSYVDESEEVVSSYGTFQWRWYNDGSLDTERLKVDDVTITGYVAETFYVFDVVFRFDSVTLGLDNYTLFVDFYTPLTGDDELGFRIDDVASPVHFVGLEQDSFNVDVAEYITATTIYLSLDDVTHRVGDSVQTTAYIERIYLASGKADWDVNGEADFILPVSWAPETQFGYDAFFIFLGLIMIPASTLYFVRGGRKDMSMDKVFFSLLVFCIGLGLLIGGVMP